MKQGLLIALTLALFIQPAFSQKLRTIYLHSGMTVSALNTKGVAPEGYPKAALGHSIGVGAEWFGNTQWNFVSNLDYSTFGGRGVYIMTDISGAAIGSMQSRFDFHDLSVGGIFAYKRPQLNYVPKAFAGPRVDFLVTSSRGGMAGINFGIDAGVGVSKHINNSVDLSLNLVYHQLFVRKVNAYYAGQLYNGGDYYVTPKYFFTLRFAFSFYFDAMDAV